jgi:hypothetical protein
LVGPAPGRVDGQEDGVELEVVVELVRQGSAKLFRRTKLGRKLDTQRTKLDAHPAGKSSAVSYLEFTYVDTNKKVSLGRDKDNDALVYPIYQKKLIFFDNKYLLMLN